MNFSFESVSSALGFFNICDQDPEIVRRVMSKAVPENSLHTHSALFNGYTEKNQGSLFRDELSEVFDNIHADSGGLQIVTRGLDNTPELRDKVYHTQAKYADVGMCFDEIPLIVTNTGSQARTDMASKIFESKKAYEYGRRTGENIKRQIDVMVDMNSQCRPQMILQGNEYEDFQNFYDGMTSILTDDYLKELRGCAVADTCIGNGLLEALDMVSMVQRLGMPDNLRNNIHLLGVGSVRRLLPVILMMRSGYFGNNVHLSYDSASHTQSFTFGKWTYASGVSKSVTRKDLKLIDDISQVLYQSYSDAIDVDYGTFYQEFCDIMVSKSAATKYVKDDPIKCARMRSIMMMWVTKQIEYFIRKVDNMITSESINDHLVSYKADRLKSLESVKTGDDYVKWRKDLQQWLRKESNRIRRDVDVSTNNDLTELFGV